MSRATKLRGRRLTVIRAYPLAFLIEEVGLFIILAPGRMSGPILPCAGSEPLTSCVAGAIAPRGRRLQDGVATPPGHFAPP